MHRVAFKRFVCFALLVLFPHLLLAETVTIPFGTTVFCETMEEVTTKRRDAADEGDIVRAQVWRDVRVDGKVVIEAGTPVYVRVSKAKKAKMAGRKGVLELEAMNVTAVDGRDVALDGGYDKSGKGRMGLSIALAAVIAWPLIFLKGKAATLERGTVFDAIVRSAVDVKAQGGAGGPAIKLSALDASVLYDEMDPDKKIKELPLYIVSRDGTVRSAEVVSVNDESITPIPIRIAGAYEDGVRGYVEFKVLSKAFTQGMNRFMVRADGESTEVLLEIEF